MATIDKRTGKDGEASYRVRVRVIDRPTLSKSFDRLTDAKRWATQIETDVRSGRAVISTEAQRHTVTDMIDRYVTNTLPAAKRYRDG